MLHKDENNNIQTTLYRKHTDQKPFLHTKSQQPRYVKSSIPYSQMLILKAICSTSTEFDKNCAIINQKNIGKKFSMRESRKLIELKENNYSYVKKNNSSKSTIPLLTTYNRKLPNISKIVNRNWNIWHRIPPRI